MFAGMAAHAGRLNEAISRHGRSIHGALEEIPSGAKQDHDSHDGGTISQDFLTELQKHEGNHPQDEWSHDG